ncbi:MAG: proline--tRNA ligase, partial [Bdellovibrionaceae bacterium]|nr:proline--tRNA ligase [Pseudobdellovibrionaceae bacterium]
RDLRGGEKSWQYIKQGVPVRVEVGPRDMAKGEVFVGRRDKAAKDKTGMARGAFVEALPKILDEIQATIFARAKAFRKANMKNVDSLKDFESFFGGDAESQAGGFALVHWNEAAIGHEILAKLKVTSRCIPLEGRDEAGACIFTGQPSKRRVVFAKSY